MCSQKTRTENYIFTINPTTTVATKSAAENAQELWEMIQTAVSEFVGTEIMLILIFITLVIFFVFLYNAKYSCMPQETCISLDIVATNFRFERTLAYLKYPSDYYCFVINFKGLVVKRIWHFGYVQMMNCLKITSRLTSLDEPLPITLYVAPWEIKNLENVLANTHHALITIYDKDQCVIDVINMTDPMSQGPAVSRGQAGRETVTSHKQRTLYPPLTPN